MSTRMKTPEEIVEEAFPDFAWSTTLEACAKIARLAQIDALKAAAGEMCECCRDGDRLVYERDAVFKWAHELKDGRVVVCILSEINDLIRTIDTKHGSENEAV